MPRDSHTIKIIKNLVKSSSSRIGCRDGKDNDENDDDGPPGNICIGFCPGPILPGPPSPPGPPIDTAPDTDDGDAVSDDDTGDGGE
jgi:hypothetical protein